MPVSIIENFQLGTNLPLDARYVVGHPNDVSLYWYDGMLIYNASTNQLFIVKDTSTEEIVEILDSSSNFVESLDASITFVYNNGLGFLQESSINYGSFFFDSSSLLDISVGKYDTIKFLAGKSSTQVLTTTYADVVSWDLALINNSTIPDDYYTWDETTGIITFGKTGWYEINVQINTDVLSGGTRANTAFKLQEDTGTGYVDIPYSETWMYNRTAGQGADNGSFSTIRQYSDGDTFKVQALEDAGDNHITSAQISIIKSEIGRSITIFDVSSGASVPYVDGSLLARDASIDQLYFDLFNNTPDFLYESSLGAGFIFNDTTDAYDVSITGAVGLYAWARTTGAGAVIDTYGLTVSRTGTGVYQYTFNSPLTNANYGIVGQPFGTIQDTNCQVVNVLNTGFELTFGSGDNGTVPDVPVDTEHSVMVLGPPTEVGLGVSRDYVDGSLALRDLDISINSYRIDIVDGSITFLDNYNGIQDISIAQNTTDITNLESSLNLYVLKAGDTMTGKLTTTALDVTGDVSLSQKVHFTEYDNISPEFGDLWVDPSGCINFAYEITGLCASSYNLQDRLLRTADDWGNFPDTSTLDDGDRILIEDAQDGFNKKYISISAFSEGVTGGFGQFPAYSESTITSSTTSTAYQNKVTLTTDSSIVDSTYRIGWALQISNSNNNRTTQYRVILDGTTILEEAAIVFSNGGNWFGFAGFQHVDLSTGGHTIELDYRVGNAGTASIRYSRLEFWRAGSEETP